jgi:DNA-binding sugar fermentation-stimulating protein
MSKSCIIYRFFDDREEKHYLNSSLDHQKLEELVEAYKKENKDKVYAKEFIDFLLKHDPEATEVEVRDFYF